MLPVCLQLQARICHDTIVIYYVSVIGGGFLEMLKLVQSINCIPLQIGYISPHCSSGVAIGKMTTRHSRGHSTVSLSLLKS